MNKKEVKIILKALQFQICLIAQNIEGERINKGSGSVKIEQLSQDIADIVSITNKIKADNE